MIVTCISHHFGCNQWNDALYCLVVSLTDEHESDISIPDHLEELYLIDSYGLINIHVWCDHFEVRLKPSGNGWPPPGNIMNPLTAINPNIYQI